MQGSQESHVLKWIRHCYIHERAEEPSQIVLQRSLFEPSSEGHVDSITGSLAQGPGLRGQRGQAEVTPCDCSEIRRFSAAVRYSEVSQIRFEVKPALYTMCV